MDRAAKLAEHARVCLEMEREYPLCPVGNRPATRAVLADIAERLGFSDLEISAAVDQALTDAGTTP